MCSDSTSMTRPAGSRRSSNSPTSACQLRPVTARMSCNRLLASSSGAKVRTFVPLAAVTSRSQPPRTLVASAAGSLLDLRDAVEAVVHRPCHLLVHPARFVAGDDLRVVPVTAQQFQQGRFRNAGENGRIGDLVLVQRENRNDGSVTGRIQE